MSRPIHALGFVVAAAALLGTFAVQSDAAAPVTARRDTAPVHAALGNVMLPCEFEANRGQTAAEADYLARCPGYVAFLTGGDAVIRTERDAFRVHVVGGRAADAAPSQPRPGRSHYLVGNDSKRWTTQVPHFRRVAYDDVLPGVGVEYRTEGRALGFDLRVAPNADPSAVRVRLDGVRWAGPDAGGNLSIGLASGGAAQLSAPRAWQETAGVRRDVDVAFAPGEGRDEFGFRVGAYDRALPLVIDPLLTVSTYLGGSATEIAYGLCVDAAGAIFITGQTTSSDFPTTTGALQTAKGDSVQGFTDAYVTKLDPSGTSLVWSTYFGGNADEHCRCIAVDASGNVHVGGTTSSSNFPLVSAYQATGTAFLAKLGSSGSAITWSTFVNGTSVIDVGLDASGNVYGLANGPRVMKFNASGSVRAYDVTSVAGSATVNVSRMAVDPSGAVWLAGSTTSNGAATNGAFQATYGGGTLGSSGDGWIGKLDGNGSRVYSTYLGGSGDDAVGDIALGPTGDVYVCGGARSSNFPTLNAHQSSYGGADDFFVARMDSTATNLVWSTYLGSTGYESAGALAVTGSGGVFAAGTASDSTFPTTDGYQASYGGSTDGAIAEFASDGSLVRSSFLGGSGDDLIQGVAVSALGEPLVAGNTDSSNFPNACSRQSLAGTTDVFLAGVAPTSTVFTDTTPALLPGATIQHTYSGQLGVAGGTGPYTWRLYSGSLPAGISLANSGSLSGTTTGPLGASVFVAEVRDANAACALRQFTLTVNAEPQITATSMPTWTVEQTYSKRVPVQGGSEPFTVTLTSGQLPDGATLDSGGTVVAEPFTAVGTATFGVHLVDRNGAAADGNLSLTVNPLPQITTTSLPEGTVLRPYDATIEWTGGTAPPTWSLASGTLPSAGGLAPATGVLGGTTLVNGDYEFTARLVDAAGAIAEHTYTVHVNAWPQMTSASLPIAVQFRPYAAAPASSGGTAPLAWTLTSGTFQEGFSSFNPATGVLTGTPTEAGRKLLVYKLTDAAGAATERGYALVVAPLADLRRGSDKEKITIAQAQSGIDVVRCVELLADTTLAIKLKVQRTNDAAIDLLLLDPTETPADLTPWAAVKPDSITVKGFPVPVTGRWFVVARPAPGFDGRVTLQISVKAPGTRRGATTFSDAGNPVDVAFSALPGSKLVVSTKSAEGSDALPTITSLRDADGNELLLPEDVHTTRRGVALRVRERLVGGDYVVTFATGNLVPGDVSWTIALSSPKGYRFGLPELPVTTR